MRYYRQFIVNIFLIILLSACSHSPKLHPLPKDGVILAFGDSLTFGTGTSSVNSYPNVLSRLTKYKVINAGVPGDTTADGLKRLPEALEKNKPALVILCLGGNDMLRKVPAIQISDNLFKLISLIKNAHAQVVVLAVPQPKISMDPPDFYAEIAKEQQVPVLEDLISNLFKQRHLKSDTIHLNAEGYRLLAEGLFVELRKLGALG
ncbi:MAG: hypothetical protein KIT27_05895 [Legionellales bacterium]|nr:hypothetical protein [Legionellales bacterium]